MSYSVVMPREGRAQVRVLDVRGRIVRALVDERLPAGRRSFTWDARGGGGSTLSNGIYFLELDTGGARRTRRFALIR